MTSSTRGLMGSARSQTVLYKKLDQGDVSQLCSYKRDLGCQAPVFSVRAPVNSTDTFRELSLNKQLFFLRTIPHGGAKIAYIELQREAH